MSLVASSVKMSFQFSVEVKKTNLLLGTVRKGIQKKITPI